MPKVSVAMLSYNCSKYLKEAVQSILSQSFSDFELLILDDKSTDNSLKILSEFTDERIHILQNAENKGIPYSRNRHLDIACGEYLAIIDSDDIAPLYRLEEQVSFMDTHPEISVLSGDIQFFGGSDWYFKMHATHNEILCNSLFGSCTPNPASILRLKAIRDSGVRYDTSYFVTSDYNFWVDLMPQIKFHNLVGKPYLYYRTDHKESITTDTTQTTAEKRAVREQLIFQTRKKLFHKLGLYITDEELALLCAIFTYPSDDPTKEMVERTKQIFNVMKKQVNTDIVDSVYFMEMLDKKVEKLFSRL